MTFKDITIREDAKGTLIADATEETVVTNSIVVTKEQLSIIIANLQEQIAKYQTLVDAIDTAAADAGGVIVTP